jgi:hypothetical protein
MWISLGLNQDLIGEKPRLTALATARCCMWLGNLVRPDTSTLEGRVREAVRNPQSSFEIIWFFLQVGIMQDSLYSNLEMTSKV